MFILFAGFFDLQAQTNVNGQNNTISTAVPFLRITPDARSGSMGDVGIAITSDANSQYWNVGKIPFSTNKFGIALSMTPWLQDQKPIIYFFYLAGYCKFGKNSNQSISGSLRYISYGDFNYVGFNFEPIGIGKPREFSYDLGYSRKLSKYLSAGISLRYIHTDIVSGFPPPDLYKPGHAVAADAGIYYTRTQVLNNSLKRNFSFGAVISNMGSKINYSSQRKDFIPMNLGLGAAYTSEINKNHKLTIAIDLNKLLVPTPIDSSTTPGVPRYYYPEKTVVSGALGSFSDAPGGVSEELKEIRVSIGSEYWYRNRYALRAGYFYEDKSNGDRRYFTIGLGAHFYGLTLNAAYLMPAGSDMSHNLLTNTIRITLAFGA